jgi:hypothetical protein
MARIYKDLGFIDGCFVGHIYYDNPMRLAEANKYKDAEREIFHCETGPAVQRFGVHTTPNFKIIEEYYIDGALHRGNDLPAMITYHRNGQPDVERWHRAGKLHRENGPAVIYYAEDGSIVHREWWIRHKQHNISGPASITQYPDQKKPQYLYYVEGVRMSKAKFLKKYLPHEYDTFLHDKIYTIDFKKYRIASIRGTQVILDEISP